MHAEIDEGELRHRTDLVRREIEATMSLTGPNPIAYSPQERGDLYVFDSIWQRIKKVQYSTCALSLHSGNLADMRLQAPEGSGKPMIASLRLDAYAIIGIQGRFIDTHQKYMGQLLEETDSASLRLFHDIDSFVDRHRFSVGICPMYPILE